MQITVCSLLLICAGLLLKGATSVANLVTGIRTRDVIALKIQEKSRDAVLERLAKEPLAGMIASSSLLPLDGGFPSARLTTSEGNLTESSYDYVSPEFFSVLDVSIERGRGFSDDEARFEAPVAIVSESFARRADTIGRSVHLAPDMRSHLSLHTHLRASEFRVIGVSGDMNTDFVDDVSSRMLVYFPVPVRAVGTVLLFRVKGNPEAGRLSIDKALAEAAPGGVDRIHWTQSFMAGRAFPFRMAWWVAAVLGALALLLTISGTYGVLSYLVAQRTREIGVRMALGATPVSAVGLVVKQAIRLAATGASIGALLGLGAWKVLASEILAVGVFDVTPFAGTALIVLVRV